MDVLMQVLAGVFGAVIAHSLIAMVINKKRMPPDEQQFVIRWSSYGFTSDIGRDMQFASLSIVFLMASALGIITLGYLAGRTGWVMMVIMAFVGAVLDTGIYFTAHSMRGKTKTHVATTDVIAEYKAKKASIDRSSTSKDHSRDEVDEEAKKPRLDLNAEMAASAKPRPAPQAPRPHTKK